MRSAKVGGPEVLFLSADDCRRLLDAPAVLEAVEEALRMDHAGAVRWPVPRSILVPAGERGARVRVKACGLDGSGAVGVRVLVFAPGGGQTRWVLVFDDDTGEPRALVDESWTYAERTAASAVLSAHRLRPPRVRRVGLIGAGRVARAALRYLGRLFPGTAVAVSSRRQETRRRVAALAAELLGMEAEAVDVEDAARGSQVVLLCTGAPSPVLSDRWVGPGTVVGALGTGECDPEFFARADLRVADSPEQLEEELVEAYGEGAPGRIDASVADVVTGAHPGRTQEGQRILVLSQGLASQDVLLAARAYREAGTRRAGTPLPIGALPGPG